MRVLKSRWFIPLIITLIAAIIGLNMNPYFLFMFTRVLIFILLIIGLNVLMGYTGQLSFAHAALFGIGAYTTGLLQLHLGLPFLLAWPIATVGTVVCGLLFALPALRMSGIYLAIATLALAQAVHWVLINWTSVTFGAGGFRAPSISLGFGLDKTQSAFLVTLVLCFVSYVLVGSLLRTSFGRRFIAVRDNQIAAASMGVNVTRTKAIAFTISAAFAGLAGGLFSALLGFVAPESFNLDQMVLMQIMVVVGGLGTMGGSIVGPVIVIALQEYLRDSHGWLEVIFGGMLIIFVIFLPKGLAPLFTDLRNRRHRQIVAEAPKTGERLAHLSTGGNNA
jgi:branched-chain amino acid transport system permease protein